MIRFNQFKRIINRIRNNESGNIMMIALIALGVGSLMIPPTLAHVGTATKAVNVYEDATARLYAADAGVESALWYLSDVEYLPEPGASGTVSPSILEDLEDLNDCSVTVTWVRLTDSIESFKITSTATAFTGGTTTIVAYAHVAPHYSEAFGYGLFALGDDKDPFDLTLGGGTTIEAYDPSGKESNPTVDVGACGGVSLNGAPLVVDGNVYATEEITAAKNSDIGEVYEGREFPVTPPDINIDAIINGVKKPFEDGMDPQYFMTEDWGNEVIDDSWDGTSKDADGVANGVVLIDCPVKTGKLELRTEDTIAFNAGLWITDDLTVSSKSNLWLGDDVYFQGGTIKYAAQAGLDIHGAHYLVAEYDIALRGGTEVGSEAMMPSATELPFIISKGDIDVTGGSVMSGMIYCPDGNVKLHNDSFYGMVLAQTIDASGTEITYPADAADWGEFETPNPGQVDVYSWEIN